MKALVFSPAAEEDLDNIWDYSVENWGQRQAERYIRMIPGHGYRAN
ncbi:type II toxin-antitoxin system RelE/ParE family toxin [Paraburkholderia youngii]